MVISVVCRRLLVIAVLSTSSLLNLPAQLLPTDVGTTVNGFQDDFEGVALGAGWQVRGQNVYSVSGGMLRVNTSSGDPNHLLYELGGYHNSVQEVLARIRVNSFGTGDGPRGGLSAAVDPGSSQGINLHFRDEPNPGQRHFEFLDDLRAWGPEFAFNWQNNAWYWLRLRHEPNAASQGGVNDVFGKIWLADGSQAEPAAWQMTYDYIPSRTARTGFAGLAASSAGGTAVFDVDYILIKAAGLPGILVSPNTFVQTPVAITNELQNQTVLECRSASFVIETRGNPRPTFQWFHDEAPIPNATNATLSFLSVRSADAGNYFVVAQNLVSNTTHSATSSVVTLTVSPDTAPPVLLGAQSLGLSQVQLQFSEPLSASSANNPTNYAIHHDSGSIAITGATRDSSGTNVILNVASLLEGTAYVVVVNLVKDECTGLNEIAADSSAGFTALSFAPVAIGNPQPAGSVVPVPGGLNMIAGGRDLGGTADEFQFSYQPRTGDFDVRVRLDSLSLADAWSEAGLIAREDLTPGSRFAGAMATPSISGSYFQHRSVANANSALSGSFPVSYPNMWLRLRRVGNVFTGFAGFDGQHWTQLGAASITMPATIHLGFAASSHNTNETTTAAFRDFSTVTAATTINRPLPAEPLGQSSRRTSLIISEIMFHPPDRSDGRNLEFVELFNTLGTPEDLSGWRLDGDADFTFPPNTVIPGGGFLVVAQSPVDVQTVHGITGVLGPFSNTNSLPNSRGTVRLRHRTGAVFLEARYDTQFPWPVAADGAGHSLVLARPSFGERNVEAWAASDAVGGSPGRMDPMPVDPLRDVVINEFLANTDEPELDFIELYNRSHQPADISGCFLSDSRNTNKFIIPPGTVLPARGFVIFDEAQLGFSLSSAGETIYFRNADRTRVLDAVRFDAQANGTSSGRYPDGAPGLHELSGKTPGTTNAAMLRRDIVINEIMYHPISGHNDDEFVELHNTGSNAVNLAGWRLMGGIDFRFPIGSVIPSGGFLVVARNAAHLMTRYPNLHANNTVGNYSGSLANSGERLVLAMADPVVTTNNNGLVTNINLVTVDEVDYRDGGRWGKWSDGGGSSLELNHPSGDNRLAQNWSDSIETAKAPWTIVSVTAVLDNPNGSVSADQLQVLLQGAGECLIDDVEVLGSNGANLIANSTFESNATGWTAEGTQSQSSWETSEGFNSARSYHLRASERGDNQVNRIRVPLITPQSLGVTNTIRAKVRWLRGHPEILFRLRGNAMEAAVTMILPPDPGTPGAPNSTIVPSPPPAIYQVSHHPPVPAANEAVIVTARIERNAGAQLRYRIDPGATINTVTMRDDGAGGDAVAGDGLFSATIPGQLTGTLVAFHVQTTGVIPNDVRRFPNDAPTRECLVRFGETVPAGNFPSYRIWMTQATFNTWDTRHNLNNTLNDVTFVLGNHRIIYNAAAVYAGSPYIAPGFNTPTGNRCGYSIDFPPDDPILGGTALVLDWPGGHGNENTAIQEQMAYWIADQINTPFSHRYFIRLTVNGVTDMQRGGVFEAVLQPGGEFLEQWVPGDADGDFFKIDRAFEFNDGGGLIADPMPQLRVYSTPDLVLGGMQKDTAAYRWTWAKRAYDRAHDYTNLFVLADVLNSTAPEPYTGQTFALVDVEEWMRVFAVEHIINNFDSWGHDIGKNMYMYKPPNGRWQIYLFDLDWLMLVAPNGPGNYTALTGPLFTSNDPTVTRMYNHPPFRRAYFRAVESAVNNAFVAAKYEPVMDAKYQSLVANGITLCDGQALAAPTAVKTWFSQRRDFLVGQLNSVGANFTVNTNAGLSGNLATITGTAPVGVASIRINGALWPVTWTSVTAWSLRLPLATGENSLTVLGYDTQGNFVAGASNQFHLTFANPLPPSPAGIVVINEIMAQPAIPRAEYVELFNTSSNVTFDLSGLRVNGLDYTFPAGSYIAPRGLLVLTRDRSAFATAYGALIPVFDEFAGNLQANGETLTLLQPGAGPAQDTVIDRVRYESLPPWSTNAAGTGSSLQLIDALQDNARVGNWTARFTPGNSSAGQTNQPVAFRSPGAPNPIATNLLPFPSVWLNEVQALNLDGIQDAASEREPWIELYNGGSNTVVLAGLYLTDNYTNLTAWPFPPDASIAPGEFKVIFADGEPGESTTDELHTNFRLMGPGGSVALVRIAHGQPQVVDYLNYHAAAGRSYGAFPDGQPFARTEFHYVTAGGTNDGRSAPRVVFINEWMADNTSASGFADPADQQFEDWFELFNPGTNSVDLAGLFLTDRLASPRQFEIPSGYVIPPGGFLLVWADGESGQNSTNQPDLHVNFSLARAGEAIGLFAADGTMIDAVTFTNQLTNVSEGRYPDGADSILFMTNFTPRQPNLGPVQSNTAPALSLIGPQSVYAGQTLIFTAEATDTEAPPQNLGFSLDAGAPGGALIHPSSGLFTWTPELGSVGVTQLTVRVTDDGNPPLSDSESISVLVLSPLSFSQAQRNGDELTWQWNAIPNRSYRIEFKNDLNAAGWSFLEDVTAIGAVMSYTTTMTDAAQRFYRVQLLP